jgi:hypothetical protein
MFNEKTGIKPGNKRIARSHKKCSILRVRENIEEKKIIYLDFYECMQHVRNYMYFFPNLRDNRA